MSSIATGLARTLFGDTAGRRALVVGATRTARGLGARLLADSGMVLVGIDYLSIEKSGSPGHPVHMALLEKEIVILEGVDLRAVPAGDYEIMCLPLKYEGGNGDGAPARTFLRELA